MGRVVLENVRLSFPQLFEAKQVMGEGKPTFSATFVMPKSGEAVKRLMAELAATGKDKWAARWDNAAFRRTVKICLRDGAEKEQFGGFGEGTMFIGARSPTRPMTLSRSKNPVGASDSPFYPGCYVDAAVDIWAQDSQHGKRINAALKAVRFREDGEALGGGAPASADDFADLEDEPGAPTGNGASTGDEEVSLADMLG